MAHRLVTVSSGRTSQRRAVRPTARSSARPTAGLAAGGAALAAGQRDGWLAFARVGDGTDAAGPAPRAAADRLVPESATRAVVLAWLAAALPVAPPRAPR
jgi:hypothetical protein